MEPSVVGMRNSAAVAAAACFETDVLADSSEVHAVAADDPHTSCFAVVGESTASADEVVIAAVVLDVDADMVGGASAFASVAGPVDYRSLTD